MNQEQTGLKKGASKSMWRRSVSWFVVVAHLAAAAASAVEAVLQLSASRSIPPQKDTAKVDHASQLQGTQFNRILKTL